jgi:hypothetical protein
MTNQIALLISSGTDYREGAKVAKKTKHPPSRPSRLRGNLSSRISAEQNQIRNSNDRMKTVSGFGFRILDLIRHSNFVIRVFSIGNEDVREQRTRI